MDGIRFTRAHRVQSQLKDVQMRHKCTDEGSVGSSKVELCGTVAMYESEDRDLDQLSQF